MALSYLIIDILLFCLAFFVHYFFKVKLFSSKRQFFLLWFFALGIGITWDYYAIVNEHWIYPSTAVVGLFLWKIPLEDYLFMIVLPYCLLIAYRLFRRKHLIKN